MAFETLTLDLLDSAITATGKVRRGTRAGDFYDLTKPRMNVLVIITTMVGFCIASRNGVNWLRLVHTLTEQLDGRIEVDRKHGTEITIVFPEPEKPSQ